MAERRVLRMGNPDLLRVSGPVTEFATAELNALVEDLWDTMAARGGIGIAAPQIGVASRVVVFGLEDDPRGLEVPRTVAVNPEIEPIGADCEDGWEGCLSVPGMRGIVSRHTRIRYRWRDVDGAAHEREADGFHARVVQHECDHLDGILYPLRMTDMRTFGFEEELSLAERFGEPRCEV